MECLSALKSAISEVLETMFFTSVEFDQLDESHQSDYYRSTKISLFSEGKNLNITFCLMESFAKMISANFIGIDEEDVAEEEVEDVMRELTNMIGGNYMGRMALDSWQLGIPSLGSFEDAPGGQVYSLSFSFMGDHVGLVVLQAVSSSRER